MGPRTRILVASIAASFLFVVSCQMPGAAPDQGASRGEFLFARHCAACHGPRGAGNALPKGTFLPPVPDFGAGLFSLVSTDNGIPTRADLAAMLRRGVPGSAMPSFGWLRDTDIDALVNEVRRLGISEMTSRLLEDPDFSLTEEQARTMAESHFTPGRSVVVPKSRKSTPALVEKGKVVYLSRCAACHGEQGTGRQPIVSWAGCMKIHWARDFTSGIMRGGVGDADLARRIQAGMPGSAMPPNSFQDPEELEGLIAFLKTLIPEGAADRLVQRPQTVRVQRQTQATRLEIGDPRWSDVVATTVVLSPMRWREEPIVHADLKAVHDGETLQLQVSWTDLVRDEPGVGETGPSDRMAVQFTDDEEPTFFGMGSARHPVHIWYWHPHPQKLSAGELDLITNPHQSMSDVGPVVRIPPKAAAVVAEGHQSAAEFSRQDRSIEVSSAWQGGRWTVVFRRKLKGDERDISFVPGQAVWIAAAIWDGATATSHADKSFTIWQRLQFD